MGINTKAVEARERKETQKRAKNEAVQRKKEEEFWRDDDKHVNRKLDRQKERDQKAQEERDRKLANKAAYEREMELAEKSAKAKPGAKQQQLAAELPKVTRHDIQKNLEEEQLKQPNLSKQLRKVNVAPIPLVPNLNRIEPEAENASSVDQALDLFKSVSIGADASMPSKSSPAASVLTGACITGSRAGKRK